MSDSLDTAEAAEFLGVSPPTLTYWRCKKTGPRYWRTSGPGSRVRYAKSDLLAYMRDRIVEPEVA
ncbi:hypothetical protein GCM10023094_09340 [Rhodococcus olei]|uniref:Helix-turn-helix domain-containing protein n=1 Tax=Rhodococcus olei TaxID=2161675 RepID=A0ABP8NXS0_9NOCA